MAMQAYGSIAAMEFRRVPRINFADIVEEFDIAFQMVDSRSRALIWESDDIAIIDRDGLRVALGWLPATEPGRRSHLVLAVGLRPGMSGRVPELVALDFVVERIVERMHQFLPFTAVLRGQVGQPVSAELMTGLFTMLRAMPCEMPGDRHRPRQDADAWQRAEMEAYAEMVERMAPHWECRRDHGAQAAGPADTTAAAAPEAKAGAEPAPRFGPVLLAHAEPTEPLRLTIHTLALSLCLYAPPVGAAMFTYSLLRDMTSSAA